MPFGGPGYKPWNKKFNSPEEKLAGRRAARLRLRQDPDYVAKNRARQSANYKRRSQTNPEKIMWASAKRRAKALGLPFNLDVTDIVVPDICPIFGFPLVRSRSGRSAFNSPSLDRVIPSLGYVKGNVKVISHKANSLKKNASYEDLMALMMYLAHHYNEQNLPVCRH